MLWAGFHSPIYNEAIVQYYYDPGVSFTPHCTACSIVILHESSPYFQLACFQFIQRLQHLLSASSLLNWLISSTSLLLFQTNSTPDQVPLSLRIARAQSFTVYLVQRKIGSKTKQTKFSSRWWTCGSSLSLSSEWRVLKTEHRARMTKFNVLL